MVPLFVYVENSFLAFHRENCTLWCWVGIKAQPSIYPIFSPFLVSAVSSIPLLFIRVFLLIQLISVISFITWLNDCCRTEKIAKRWYVLNFIHSNCIEMLCFLMYSVVFPSFLVTLTMLSYIKQIFDEKYGEDS